MSDCERVKKVLSKKQKSLFKKKGVVATGIGYKVIDGEQTNILSLICSVDEKITSSKLRKRDMVPSILSGIQTDVIETGIIKALRTSRHRPMPGGVSIGHVKISAGSSGPVVRGTINEVRYILSNNHVLACSNDAIIGDHILQPGTHDGGVYSSDHIAELSDFVPISFMGIPSDCPISNKVTGMINGILRIIGSKTRLQSVIQTEDNLVDAAIARPLKDEDISDEIIEIGTIVGVMDPFLGMKIQKSGRTTKLTTGEITQIDVTVNVQYGAGKIATFTDQFMAGKMCEGGDSGSAVLDMNKNLVGLLFGGSDTSMVASKITNVFKLLDVHL